ncbi:hypothetical protein [Ruminococcus gauvreauii]|uniref:hypothetical protein n=1 Tax=Ruminococcus gauvreauii TaxID=438033 RepID=UPI0039844192
MADELFQGVKIKDLPLTTTINDTDDFVIEDSVPTTRRTRFSSLVTAIKNKIAPDSGWQTITAYGTYMKLYGTADVMYRKFGKVVNVHGVMTPTQELNMSGPDASFLMFTLPSGYRPKTTVYAICQGSGTNKWLLAIGTDGQARFERYASSTGYVNPKTGAWLPFNITFITAA